MVDKTLPALDAVVTPVATDILLTRQAADTEDRRYTRAQIYTLLAGEHLIFPQVDEAATPTLAFGDGDTGLFESADDVLKFAINGTARLTLDENGLQANLANGYIMLDENASAINPTVIPNKTDLNTGVGHASADALTLIAGQEEIARFTFAAALKQMLLPAQNDAGVPSLGFGDGDTGFYENADDNITVAINSVAEWQMNAFNFGSASSSRPVFRNVAMTATVPAILPRLNDLDTGIGGVGSDSMSFIAGGVNVATLVEAAGVVQMIMPSQNNATNPSIAFGDGDTGMYEQSDDIINWSISGVDRMHLEATLLRSGNFTNSWGLVCNNTPSGTVPVIVPAANDTNTGLGHRAADVLTLIAGNQNCIECAENGAAAEVGFYATTPVAQQTGVAVTAAGIHAALVALGLITA